MGQEIERKFLVTSDAYRQLAHSKSRIVQGYISRTSGRTVRVRVRGEKGYLTIKGPSLDGGLSRYEWEYEIPVQEAIELMTVCEQGVIDKVRYLVNYGHHTYEVDEFHGDNEGLVVAEIELESVDAAFEKPSFVGREVTGDRRYYNSCLTRNPYTQWPAADKHQPCDDGLPVKP